jgi:hypothetical protein
VGKRLFDGRLGQRDRGRSAGEREEANGFANVGFRRVDLQR